MAAARKRKRKKKLRLRDPAIGMKPGKTVSGMPDGGDVSTRNSATRDDLESAYDFVKKQKRRV